MKKQSTKLFYSKFSYHFVECSFIQITSPNDLLLQLGELFVGIFSIMQ